MPACPDRDGKPTLLTRPKRGLPAVAGLLGPADQSVEADPLAGVVDRPAGEVAEALVRLGRDHEQVGAGGALVERREGHVEEVAVDPPRAQPVAGVVLPGEAGSRK